MIGTSKRLRRTIDKTEKTFTMEILSTFRQYLHLFSNGKNSNALAVFICIALHTNDYGWAWPKQELIMEETGLRTRNAVAEALSLLRTIVIDGHPILRQYRRVVNNIQGANYYHVFPDADGADQMPESGLVLVDDSRQSIIEHRRMDDPYIEEKADIADSDAKNPENPRCMDDPYIEESTKLEDTPSAAAPRKAPSAQKTAVFRTKKRGEVFHQPEKKPSPQPSVGAEEPVSQANKSIAALFGKERLSKADSGLLAEPIVGKDSERHASLNQLQEDAPEAFQTWIDRAYTKWRAGGGKEIKHFLHSLRVQSSNTYQPVDFDSVQKDIWGE